MKGKGLMVVQGVSIDSNPLHSCLTDCCVKPSVLVHQQTKNAVYRGFDQQTLHEGVYRVLYQRLVNVVSQRGHFMNVSTMGYASFLQMST